MSNLHQFIAELRALHEKAKGGALTAAERSRYTDARQRIEKLVVAAQQLAHAGKPLRADLRMAKMLKVELRPDDGDSTRTSTLDLASGGFAVLLGTAMPTGRGAEFTIHLPAQASGPTPPISGRCSVVGSKPQTGAFRVSFKFDKLALEMQERLEMALIDAVLERFKDV